MKFLVIISVLFSLNVFAQDEIKLFSVEDYVSWRINTKFVQTSDGVGINFSAESLSYGDADLDSEIVFEKTILLPNAITRKEGKKTYIDLQTKNGIVNCGYVKESRILANTHKFTNCSFRIAKSVKLVKIENEPSRDYTDFGDDAPYAGSSYTIKKKIHTWFLAIK